MPRRKIATVGTVYLIHFDQKLAGHAQHYVGYADNLDARMRHHKAGTGAKIMAAVEQAQIPWAVARTWPDATRNDERRIKRQRNHRRLCPACHGAK